MSCISSCGKPQATPASSLHQVARAYAQRGWPVFPCVPGDKAPAIKNGFYAATTNPTTIDRWWRTNPHYNIGVRCGAGSGLWVLDLDGSGADTIRRHGVLPATLIAVTAKGKHLYFATDRDLPSTTGKIGAGIDTRGRGGYVLAPPSVHPCGKIYQWVTDIEPAAPPDWLVRLACKPSIAQRAIAGINTIIVAKAVNDINADAYGKAALASEIATLAATPKGGRNDQLNRFAFNLGQLVGGRVLAEPVIVAHLIEGCYANGLWADDGSRRCVATIRSGIRAGLQHPRGRP